MANVYFSVYDYLILILIFLLSITIGLFQSRPIELFKTKLKKIKNYICRKRTAIVSETTEMKKFRSNDNNNVKLNNQQKIDENQNINEYFIGSKNVNIIPVSLSILASIFSTNTLIGTPAEVYQYGIQINIMILSVVTACMISTFVFLPLIGKLNIVTLNEYFQLRFNSKAIRIITIISYASGALLWYGTIIYGTGTSLSSVTGLNIYLSMTIIGLVTVLYTAFGGIRGVIWADAFQLIVMMCGLILIVVKGSYDISGIGKIWKIASDGGRINLFDFRTNPFIRQTFWSIYFGNLFRWVMGFSIDQATIQRFSAVKTIKKAQCAMLINAVGSAILLLLCGFIGLIIYATYAECDPLSIPSISRIRNPNQLLAYYVNDRLVSIPGASGFFQGTLLSAALSTLSSILNGQVAILWKDVFKQFSYFQSFSDTKSLQAAKVLVVVTGLIGILFAFLVSSTGGNLVQLGILFFNVLSPPIALLFLMGTCFYFVNYKGAIAGSFFALVVGAWILTGVFIVKPVYPTLSSGCGNISNLTTYKNVSLILESGEALNVFGFKKIYSISFHLFSLIIVSVGLLIGLITSVATGGLRNEIPNNLVLFNRKLHQNNNDHWSVSVKF